MVILNIPCIIIKPAGHDVYGQEIAGQAQREKCAIVKLTVASQHSTVRVDSGATRGAADEAVSDSVILLGKKSIVGLDDYIEVSSVKLRVKAIRSRFTVSGKLDHYEVRCEIE